MRLRSLLLAASISAAPIAHGQGMVSPVEFTAFSVVGTNEMGYNVPFPLGLVSDIAGSTVFSVPGIDALNVISGGTTGDSAEYFLTLVVVPRDGYVITGYELSGVMTGMLDLDPPPPGAYNIRPGRVENDANFCFCHVYPGDVHYQDIEGVADFSLSRPPIPPTPGYPFVEVNVSAYVHANGVRTYYDYLTDSGWESGSTGVGASMDLSDTRLTVYWSIVPVPEPGSWAMLLVGLVRVGWVARRKALGLSHRDNPCELSA